MKTLFVVLAAAFALCGCKPHMSYEKVMEAEMYCVHNGLTPLRATYGKMVTEVYCMDKNGNAFTVPVEEIK
jgi:uncharacterized protein affecting Mg2+/Co2+ transport